jgi:hypothetical protein
LQVNHWIYRAPELHYGDVAFDCAVDVWSVGCVALEALRGRPWLSGDEKQLTNLFNNQFGGSNLQLAFQHLPRFIHSENKSPDNRSLFEGVTLSARAQQALSAPFVLNPSQRLTSLEISQMEWLQDEKTMDVKYDFEAYYGQMVVKAGSVSDACLAALRNDDFFVDARQKELELGFAKKRRRLENSEIRCTEDVAPHGTVKLTLSGHIGHGSVASTINDLVNVRTLPYDAGCAWVRAFLTKNTLVLTDLNNLMIHETKQQLKEQIQKQFKGRGVPNDNTCPIGWRNVRDVLHCKNWMEVLLSAAQLHINRKSEVPINLPRHFDGGRGALVLCVRLFGNPTLRFWQTDGTFIDLPSSPGDVYITSMLAAEHQVMHSERDAKSDMHESEALGATEVTLFVRSATLAHNRCSVSGRLWCDDIDGALCSALRDSITSWLRTHELALPDAHELQQEIAQPSSSKASKPAAKRRKT